MEIIGYTCTFNEEKYIPYVMPYVENFGYDKFIVYDNGSTDNTVEMLSKYPFVEIRRWDTGGVFDDRAKCELQRSAFHECKMRQGNGNELVWMTFTDFDEVLFYNGDVDIKAALTEDRIWRGYNCFYKNMVNLFPPSMDKRLGWICDEKNKLVHAVDGVLANYWVGGMKPTMILVNDFDEFTPTPGNHYGFARPIQGVEIKNYDDCCRMYGFHLKFIDPVALKEKWESYAQRNKEVYVKNIEKFDEIYLAQMSLSFPVRDYFLADGMRSRLQSCDIPYHGLLLF